MLTSIRDVIEMAVLAALVAAAVWAVWRVQRGAGFGVRPRVLVGLLSLSIGAGLCFFPYRTHSGMRMLGFPLPLVIQLNRGTSLGTLPSPIGMGLAGTLNVVLVSGVIHGVVLGWFRRQGSGTASV